MLPYEDAHVAELLSGLKDALNESQRLHDAIVGAFYGGPFNPTKPVKQMAVDTTHALLSKGCKTHRAVEILCANGLGEDASTLVRSLLESLLMTLFIYHRDDGEEVRTAMIHAYSTRQHLKALYKWRTIPDTPDLQLEEIDELIVTLKQTRDGLEGRLPEGVSIKSHWSGRANLEQAADLLNYNTVYQLFYRTLSTHLHGTDLGSHLSLNEESGVRTAKVCPSGAHCTQALSVARHVLWTMAKTLNDRLGLGIEQTLEAVAPSPIAG